MINSITKLRRLVPSEALLKNKSYQSTQDEVFELHGGQSVPPTFARAMLQLSPCQKGIPSVFSLTPEGDIDFYGHKRLAKSTSTFITKTFGCPEESLLSKVFLQPSLPYFIAAIIHTTQAPYSVVSSVRILLERYRTQLPPNVDSSRSSGHRLFISAYIYAIRENCPRNEKIFDNEYWSQISNFTANDIGVMLDYFYEKLQGNVGVHSRFKTTTNIKENPIVIMEYHGAESGRTLKSKVSWIFSRKPKRRDSLCASSVTDEGL